MSTRSRKSPNSGASPDVYQRITDALIRELERGSVPWHRPWVTMRPRNAVTGRPYSGVNLLLLGSQPFDDPRWLTFEQARRLGGHVRRGERGTCIVLLKRTTRTVEDGDGEAVERRAVYLRGYVVFNVEQCDGVVEQLPALEELPAPVGWDPGAAAEAIVAGYPDPPVIRHGGDRAFYRAATDTVTVPPRAAFESPGAYYGTLYHELTHSTGHASRCARPEVGTSAFGSEPYSREELVAEIGAAFLLAEAGLEPAIEHHAAYVQNWLRALRNDKRLVVTAAARAQKAVDHILGRPSTGRGDEGGGAAGVTGVEVTPVTPGRAARLAA